MKNLICCVCCCVATSTAPFAAATESAGAASRATKPACSEAEYHGLDFWIGDWDAYDTDAPNGPAQARAQVDAIVNGCAIHELYTQADGLVGDSILSYDPVRKQWQQTWVTNRGAIMVIVGNFKDGALVLEGDVHLKDGRSVRQRITWTKQDSTVRESAVMSRDLGKTWAPAFDVLFVRRVGASGERRSERKTAPSPGPLPSLA